MAITYDYITIQASHTGLTPVIEAKQGNSGRGVVVTIPDIDLVGKTIYVFVKKPDDTEVYDYGSVNARGQAVINFNEQMLAAVGDAKMEIQIFQGDTVVSSFNIIIEVLASLSGSSHVASTDDYKVLRDLITDTETAITNTNEAAENATEAAENANTAADRIMTDMYSVGASHNSHYRGKNLGTEVTAEQYAAIADGTFADMYIGDYWVIGGTVYRIAAINYYWNTGDVTCQTNHITLVPRFALGTNKKMNDTNTTTGGYVNSLMRTQNMEEAKTIINNAFGAEHILTHRRYLTNATNNGVASAGAWYDSDIELMTEQNVYGGIIYDGYVNNGNWVERCDIDCVQYPLFMFQHSEITSSRTYWLRNVASGSNFCACISNSGSAGYPLAVLASSVNGVRPAFSIKA